MKRLAAGAWLVVFAFWAPSARAQESKTDFDQGIDAGAALRQAREAQKAAPLATPPSAAVARHTDRDCVTVSFNAQDPLVSERIHLVSREYREVCHPGPNGGQQCHEELAWTHRASVRIQIADRGPMLPWEKDVFWMCLDGSWLEADVLDASHRYDLKFQGGADTTLLAKALEKTAALPDPNGLAARPPRAEAASKSMVWDLQDLWSEYYGSGEQTVLSFQLKRSRDNWFDALVLEKEVSLPAAKLYTVRFADYAQEMSEPVKPGSKYYMNWRFKRVGKVSKDKWTKYRETEKAVFDPAGAAEFITFSQDQVQTLWKVCWLKAVDKDDCVYKCSDKTEHRQPAQAPDPLHPDQPVLACPQLVFPF